MIWTCMLIWFILCTGIISDATISANTNNIFMLSGINFKEWKENVLIVLGCMDLDLVLRIEQPTSLTAESSPDDRKNFEKSECSNRISLIIIKRGILEAFWGTVSDEITLVKDFLAEIEKRFAKNDKTETSTLLASLISMRYKGKRNIRENIMQMSHIASKLKALNLELSEDLLVHLVLIRFLHNSINLRSVITVRRKNGLWMNSFHIVCKKRKDFSIRNLKVLIMSVPQRIRARKERRMKLLRVQIKRNLRKVKTVSFVRNLDT